MIVKKMDTVQHHPEPSLPIEVSQISYLKGLKEEGNKHFKAKNITEALVKYQEACKYIENLYGKEDGAPDLCRHLLGSM